MKTLFQLSTLCFLVFSLTGCGSSAKDNPRSQSAFKENFLIGTIFEDNSQHLIPGSRQLFGSESGPPEPFTQKLEKMLVLINPADLPNFLLALRSSVKEAIVNSGASIVGHGQGSVTGTSFSISYRENTECRTSTP